MHQPPPPLQVTWNFLALLLFRVVGDHLVFNLTFRGSLASTPLLLFVGFSPFVLWVPSIITLVDD